MKKCPRCNGTKPLSEFYKDRTRPDGRKAWCKACAAADRKAQYERDPKRWREYSRKWAERNPEKVRQRGRRSEMSRSTKTHAGPDEWARMYAEQDGHCYLCGRPFLPNDRIHVDHDHECCDRPQGRPNGTASCKACRRGLAHEACNQIIGLAREDMDVLRAIAVNFEPVRDAAKERIAANQSQQLELAI